MPLVEMNVSLYNAKIMPANMVVYVFQWGMVYNVSAQQDFQDEDAKSILMNAVLSHVTMVELVLIYRKVINVNVLQDILASIARKNDRIVQMTRAPLEQCVKMNQVIKISHVFAVPATQVLIATLL